MDLVNTINISLSLIKRDVIYQTVLINHHQWYFKQTSSKTGRKKYSWINIDFAYIHRIKMNKLLIHNIVVYL